LGNTFKKINLSAGDYHYFFTCSDSGKRSKNIIW